MSQLGMLQGVGVIELLILASLGLGVLGVLFVVVYFAVKAANGSKP